MAGLTARGIDAGSAEAGGSSPHNAHAMSGLFSARREEPAGSDPGTGAVPGRWWPGVRCGCHVAVTPVDEDHGTPRVEERRNMRLYAQSNAKLGAMSLPRRPRRLVGALAGVLVVGTSTLGLGLGAAGAGAEVQVKSPKKILLKDPLSKPSSAARLMIFTRPDGSGSFVNGKYLFQNEKAGFLVSSPNFDATNAQLSATSAAIDMSFPTSAPQFAGLNCRQGDTIDTRYSFLVGPNGSWLIGKAVINQSNTKLKQGTGKQLRPNETVHLRAECSGPEQPGPSGKVTLKFFVNGKNVGTVTDATSALPVTDKSNIGLEINVPGSVAFSNVTITAL
jgi:hypothetical protein